MTNVPPDIREAWADIYRLFDNYYLMDVNDQEQWKSYWLDACKLIEKHEKIPSLIDLLSVVSEIISKLAAGRGNS